MCPRLDTRTGAHTGITTPKKLITMTLRTIAHHLGLPVRRDPHDVAKIIEGLRPDLAELPDDRRERLAAEWTRVLSERHWHWPYLRD